MAILLFILFVSIFFMSCNDKSTKPPEPPETSKICVMLYSHIINDLFDEFLLSYSEWSLKMIDYHHQASNTIFLSFNKSIMDEIEFLDMIRKDDRVLQAEFHPFLNWIFGELTIHLHKNIKGETFDEFLFSYKEWELSIKEYYDRISNIIIFTYNYEIIDELIFISILRDDQRVKRVEFEPFNSDYYSLLMITLHDLNDIEEIVQKYSEYKFNLKLREINEQDNSVIFTFNQSADRTFIAYLFFHDPLILVTGTFILSATLSIGLHDYVVGDILDEFVRSYSEWDFRITSTSPHNNFFQCFFNLDSVSMFEMREFLKMIKK